MRRVFFLSTARSGSTFMECMLRGEIDTTVLALSGKDPEKMLLPAPVWLHTLPPRQCQFYGMNGPCIDSLITQTRKADVAEAYSMRMPTTAGKAWFNSLGEGDWKFIYLLRDPRNRIESACAGNPAVREMVFRQECAVAKTSIPYLLEMMNDPRFKAFRFEDLVVNPLEALKKMFLFAGFKLNVEFYKKLIPKWYKQSNSSFCDKGVGANERWLSWTPKEKEYFKKEVGSYLAKLSYEKDGD